MSTYAHRVGPLPSRILEDLGRVYASSPALWAADHDAEGFAWIDADDSDNSVLSFLRWDADHSEPIACVANLTPVPRHGYRVGLPLPGQWVELMNTDWPEFAGGDYGINKVILVYFFAVALLAGSLGYSLGAGIMMMITPELSFLVWLIGIIVTNRQVVLAPADVLVVRSIRKSDILEPSVVIPIKIQLSDIG